MPHGLLHAVLGAALWFALFKSGVDPVVTGLAVGLLTFASPAARVDLERATDLFKLFREQPTPELARSARIGLTSAISPNERLQQVFHPWTSYVIVPLFALANAGVAVNGGLLSRAFSSPITLGILVGYVVGKPVGIAGVSWLVTRLSGGRLRPPVGWAGVAGGGLIAGIGFTVSLLIASLAFHGAQLEEAKIGVLSAALVASSATWLLFRTTSLLPTRLRIRALLGTAEVIVDLAAPVDPDRDHIRGPEAAPVTLVEYGDFECPFCGQAEDVIRELLADFGDVRYVWRHLPLNDVHPRAQLASEAAEAASNQGRFWELHDLLLDRQEALKPQRSDALCRGARTRRRAVHRRTCTPMPERAHIAEDVDGADLSGVSGTPTFFVNGRRHYGAYDIEALSKAVASRESPRVVARRPGREPHAPGAGACACSQASPAASTGLVVGRDQLEVADGERGPAEDVERPKERREREAHLELVAVDRRQLLPDDGRDIEVDRRAEARASAAPTPCAASASAGVTACACSSFARTLPPYSSLRAGNVAAVRLRGLAHEERPGVLGRLRDLGLDDERAERLERLDVALGRVVRAAGPARRPTAAWSGARRSIPRSRGRRRRLAGQRRPHRNDLGDGPRHRADGVERRAEREDARGRDPPPARLEPDDAAAGCRQPDRAARVGAEAEVAQAGGERGGVAAGRAARRPARLDAGSAPCRTTGSGS